MSTAVATQDHVNRKHFGDLTPRMNQYREEVLDKKPYICCRARDFSY